jgi:hypothetical protein
MKRKPNNTSALIVGLAMALCLVASPIPVLADSTFSLQKQESQSAGTDSSQLVVKAFEERVEEYVKLREGLEEKMPKLSKEAKPEEIEAHKKSFQEIVRGARANAKPGDVFTPDIVNYIRATIKREFKGKKLVELRETILEAETKGVAVRVNYPYPETKELVEMPPTLLLILPQLPKQVRYRYVGKHLLLVDRENGLIIDYTLNALPETGRAKQSSRKGGEL